MESSPHRKGSFLCCCGFFFFFSVIDAQNSWGESRVTSGEGLLLKVKLHPWNRYRAEVNDFLDLIYGWEADQLGGEGIGVLFSQGTERFLL